MARFPSARTATKGIRRVPLVPPARTPEFLGEIDQDRSRFEDPDRLRTAAVDEGRDLRIRIHRDETAAELLAVADLDQPGVVLGAAPSERQKLFERNGDFTPFGVPSE
jgi:hypothetical protein